MRRPARSLAVVVAVVAACARPAAVGRIGKEPDLRVGLAVGVTVVRVVGEGGIAAVEHGSAVFRLPRRTEVRLVPEGRGIRVAEGASAGRYESLTFVSLQHGRFVVVDDRPYRGVVEVLAGAGGLVVVNEVPLEAYVAGVVNAEMGRRARDERAALEAQAIASRTYALANRGKFGAEGYDLRAGVEDQAYGGVAAETEDGRAAVRATAGLVIAYRGALIAPFYHSTCGSATASPDEAFRSARRVPYLRPVSDRSPGGYYCDRSPRFRWTVEWDGVSLRDILRRTIPLVIGVDGARLDVVRDVRVHRTGPSGRVGEMRVQVATGEIPVFGPDVRTVFQTPDGRTLGSTALELEVERRDGVVARLVARGAGWGHGVGMCQWGAVGRARAGQDARTIITTYFPGTTIDRWY